MLKDPPATTLFVLDIRSETLSTDPSLDEESLKKLFDVNLVCSFTEVLKNWRLFVLRNSSSLVVSSKFC
jgi:hypothetical protein